MYRERRYGFAEIRWALQVGIGEAAASSGASRPVPFVRGIARRPSQGRVRWSTDPEISPAAWDARMTALTCANHPDRASRTNLDGDELCQECADAWVRGEGEHAAWLEAEGLEGRE